MIDTEKQTIETVKTVSPAVVSIIISKFMPKIRQMPFAPFNPFGEQGGPLPEVPIEKHHHLESGKGEKVKVGGGSGFIVHSDGLVLTNKHVVYDAEAEYTVITSDDKEYTGKVISRDPVNDVAVIKINVKGLPTVELGDSNSIEMGQTVIAIGNALGLFTNTVSKGIVSGLGRKISAALGQSGQTENLRDVIQTDVAINQGNSGGPLVNLEGKVIGINTAIIFGAQNIGFAIPINWAKADLDDLIKFGRIVRPYIGLRYVTLNKTLQARYALPIDYGALVIKDHVPGSRAVVPDSPADKAGLKENDIVLEINGEKLTEKNELTDIIQSSKVGDELEMEVSRNGKALKLKTILEERK